MMTKKMPRRNYELNKREFFVHVVVGRGHKCNRWNINLVPVQKKNLIHFACLLFMSMGIVPF